MAPNLPDEMWQEICEIGWLKGFELATMASVSRKFAEIARPVLYRSVKLQMGTRASTRDTLELLASNRQLAKAVVSLSLLGFWSCEAEHEPLVSLLSVVLENMVSLCEVKAMGNIFANSKERTSFFDILSGLEQLRKLKIWSDVGEVEGRSLGAFKLSDLVVKEWTTVIPSEKRSQPFGTSLTGNWHSKPGSTNLAVLTPAPGEPDPAFQVQLPFGMALLGHGVSQFGDSLSTHRHARRGLCGAPARRGEQVPAETCGQARVHRAHWLLQPGHPFAKRNPRMSDQTGTPQGWGRTRRCGTRVCGEANGYEVGNRMQVGHPLPSLPVERAGKFDIGISRKGPRVDRPVTTALATVHGNSSVFSNASHLSTHPELPVRPPPGTGDGREKALSRTEDPGGG